MAVLILIFVPCIFLYAQHLSAKDKLEILSVLQKQQMCWNKGDIDCYMEGYWKSDSLRFIGKNGIQYGWEKTLQNYKKSYPDKITMGNLSFKLISLEELNDHTAFMIGKWSLKRTKDELSGYFSLIWQKKNGRWVITTDHSS